MEAQDKSPLSLIKIYVVADNRLLRETLVRLLRKRNDVCVVGQNSYCGSTLEQFACPPPDLLLVDFFAPNQKPGALIYDLREFYPKTKVILFGMDEGRALFLQAVQLGVKGYLLKNASSAELVDAVRAVAQGEAVCPPRYCKTLFQSIADEWAQKTAIALQQTGMRFELTHRQRQLMALVATGLSNKEIAANLHLSEFTVKNHIYRIMKQVDAQSRHEAVDLIRASAVHESWQKLSAKNIAENAIEASIV